VELVPRRGAFVKRLSAGELLQLYDVRLRLEPLGASEAADRINSAGISLLDTVLESHRQAVASSVATDVRVADYRFHMAIVAIARNQVLERILSSFAIVSKSNQSGLMKPAEKSLAEHVGLHDAIVTGNASLAERLMYAHLLEARDAAARLAETTPQIQAVY